MRKCFKIMLLCGLLLLPACPCLAAHPLLTDDAGTLGKGNYQLELSGQYDRDRDDGDGATVRTDGGQVAATLSCGLADNVDLMLTLPYQWRRNEENQATTYDEKGTGDLVVETKWRFLEKDGYSLALKPGITLPAGDYEKGLGTGRAGGRLFLIGSKEAGDWAFHANLGYRHNENRAGDRVHLWHASLAATRALIKNLKLVANIGVERNPAEASGIDPAFVLGGVIYSLTESFDLDCGLKYGLTATENDFCLLVGLTFRF